ncbi:hypothetical protein BU17DRAFT_63479 [Hysterangium stoloniferum]|nr:hypothetical protein BU17DRAFT_63479 [Hysterangium stoloniferum]
MSPTMSSNRTRALSAGVLPKVQGVCGRVVGAAVMSDNSFVLFRCFSINKFLYPATFTARAGKSRNRRGPTPATPHRAARDGRSHFYIASLSFLCMWREPVSSHASFTSGAGSVLVVFVRSSMCVSRVAILTPSRHPCREWKTIKVKIKVAFQETNEEGVDLAGSCMSFVEWEWLLGLEIGQFTQKI